MKENNIQLALNLTAPQGAILTAREIEQCDVRFFAVELLPLLFKPGLSYFEKENSLADYFALQGDWILDSRLQWNASKEGFAVRSPFDGHYDVLPVAQWLSLIEQMKPSALILPESLMRDKPHWLSNLQSSVRCFTLAAASEQSYKEGQLYVAEQQSSKILLTNLTGKPFCQLQSQHPSLLVLSASPFTDAADGIVYLNDEVIDIKATCWQNDFHLLDEDCSCPTCQQGFTRAYLHHLYQQTPLLCHRFLAEHNLWTYQKKG